MKKISKLMMLALLTLGMGLTSCETTSDNPVTPDVPVVPDVTPEEDGVTAIAFDLSKIDEKYFDADKTKVQLTVGDELTLSFTIQPAELADTQVELTSADATILSIDGLKVKALKEGETKVTAKAGEKTAECTVTVKAATILVTSVTLDKTELSLTIGDAAVQLTATVAPDNATDKTVTWTSDKTDIATVDDKGNVTAVAEGTAIITAKSGEKTATCTVTVSAATVHALSDSKVGEIVGTDGQAYPLSLKDDLPSGVTAAGMVAYKNGSNGLVIALLNHGNMDWKQATGASGAAAYKPTVTGETWKLPSTDEWKQMFQANGGDEGSYIGLNTAIGNAGGSPLLQFCMYWTSTEDVLEGYANFFDFMDGSANLGGSGDKTTARYVRACFAF